MSEIESSKIVEIDKKNLQINEKIDYQVKIDMLKMAFEYTKEKYNNLVDEIKEIRAVSNYILTAVLVFSGFIISSDKYIGNLTQKIIFYGLLVTILGVWLWINWTVNVAVGFDSNAVPQLIKDIEKDIVQYEGFKFYPNKNLTLYESLIYDQNSKYANAEDIINQKFHFKKRVLIVLAILYFFITIIFIIISKFQIFITL